MILLKIIFVVVAALSILAATTINLTDAFPAAEQDEHHLDKRITCDIFESEELCSAHCVVLIKPGGYCSDGTCICNKWWWE